jgi:hypothetical protein
MGGPADGDFGYHHQHIKDSGDLYSTGKYTGAVSFTDWSSSTIEQMVAQMSQLHDGQYTAAAQQWTRIAGQLTQLRSSLTGAGNALLPQWDPAGSDAAAVFFDRVGASSWSLDQWITTATSNAATLNLMAKDLTAARQKLQVVYQNFLAEWNQNVNKANYYATPEGMSELMKLGLQEGAGGGIPDVSVQDWQRPLFKAADAARKKYTAQAGEVMTSLGKTYRENSGGLLEGDPFQGPTAAVNPLAALGQRIKAGGGGRLPGGGNAAARLRGAAQQKAAAQRELAAEQRLLAQQQLAAEQKAAAAQQLAAQQLAAQQLTAQQLSAQRLAAQRLAAAQQTAAQQLSAQQLAAQQLSVQQLAAQQLAAQQLAMQQLSAQQLAAQQLSAAQQLAAQQLAALPAGPAAGGATAAAAALTPSEAAAFGAPRSLGQSGIPGGLGGAGAGPLLEGARRTTAAGGGFGSAGELRGRLGGASGSGSAGGLPGGGGQPLSGRRGRGENTDRAADSSTAVRPEREDYLADLPTVAAQPTSRLMSGGFPGATAPPPPSLTSRDREASGSAGTGRRTGPAGGGPQGRPGRQPGDLGGRRRNDRKAEASRADEDDLLAVAPAPPDLTGRHGLPAVDLAALAATVEAVTALPGSRPAPAPVAPAVRLGPTGRRAGADPEPASDATEDELWSPAPAPAPASGIGETDQKPDQKSSRRVTGAG